MNYVVTEAICVFDSEECSHSEITDVKIFGDKQDAIDYAQKAIETCAWNSDVAVFQVTSLGDSKKIYPEINWHLSR